MGQGKYIPIPSYFTKEYYFKQKELKKPDEEIAEDLDISKPLLDKWKKKIGLVKGDVKGMAGRKPNGDLNKAIQLIKEKKTYAEITNLTGITKGTLSKYARLIREGVIK